MDNFEEPLDESMLIATFHLGGALFGIDARQVQEVVKLGDLTCVHHSPSYVLGIRNLRGKIVTVIDLSECLELGASSITPDTRILIFEWLNEPIGLLVDSLSDTIAITPDKIEAAPPSLHGIQGKNVLGVCRSANRLVALLNPDTILQTENDTANPSLMKAQSV
jgi:purine-binding chemotaxis protein CheW